MGTDPKQILIEQVASYALDPLGFVFFAFPWGEPGTELANSTGLRDWHGLRDKRDMHARARAGRQAIVTEPGF